MSSRPALGTTQPPSQWVPGALSPEREADHSPPTSAEVVKTWVYTSTPPYVFMAQGQLYLTFILVYVLSKNEPRYAETYVKVKILLAS
jgi:hypothetical protein